MFSFTLHFQGSIEFLTTDMKFSLVDSGKSKNGLPRVEVTFSDGYKDKLILKRHYFKEEDRMSDLNKVEGCQYIGHLAKEKDACVAMTGCLGHDDIEFTIMSSHVPVDTFGFVWTKTGEVHTINKNVRRFKNGTRTLFSLGLAISEDAK